MTSTHKLLHKCLLFEDFPTARLCSFYIFSNCWFILHFWGSRTNKYAMKNVWAKWYLCCWDSTDRIVSNCHSSSLSMKLWNNNVLDMDLLWLSLSNWSTIIIWLISPAASMIYPSIPLFTLPSITKKFSAHHLLALHLWVWHDTCNWCFQDS